MWIGNKSEIISELRTNILRIEGLKFSNHAALDAQLTPIIEAFPNNTFPLGCLHEFLSERAEDKSATTGFISGLLATLISNKGSALWISSCRTLFPPALKNFGIEPDRLIFIDLHKERDVMWALDEALRCSAVTAVVGELREIDFTTSRRLQLAVEQSQVTGFILRHSYRQLNTTACVSRWKITSLPSENANEMPGIGFPRWRVELLKVRNGKPGVWNVSWINRNFQFASEEFSSLNPESNILYAAPNFKNTG